MKKQTGSNEIGKLLNGSQALFIGEIQEIKKESLSIKDLCGIIIFQLTEHRAIELKEDFKLFDSIAIHAQIKKHQSSITLHIIKISKVKP